MLIVTIPRLKKAAKQISTSSSEMLVEACRNILHRLSISSNFENLAGMFLAVSQAAAAVLQVSA